MCILHNKTFENKQVWDVWSFCLSCSSIFLSICEIKTTHPNNLSSMLSLLPLFCLSKSFSIQEFHEIWLTTVYCTIRTFTQPMVLQWLLAFGSGTSSVLTNFSPPHWSFLYAFRGKRNSRKDVTTSGPTRTSRHVLRIVEQFSILICFQDIVKTNQPGRTDHSNVRGEIWSAVWNLQVPCSCYNAMEVNHHERSLGGCRHPAIKKW